MHFLCVFIHHILNHCGLIEATLFPLHILHCQVSPEIHFKNQKNICIVLARAALSNRCNIYKLTKCLEVFLKVLSNVSSILLLASLVVAIVCTCMPQKYKNMSWENNLSLAIICQSQTEREKQTH